MRRGPDRRGGGKPDDGLAPVIPLRPPGRTAADPADVELVVREVGRGAVRCTPVGGDARVMFHAPRVAQFVPGHVLTVRPTGRRRDRKAEHLSGEVVDTRIDAAAYGLPVLRVAAQWSWNPLDWEADESAPALRAFALAVRRRGPRPSYQMEVVVPFRDPERMADEDPLYDALDHIARGDVATGRTMLQGLLAEDLRCLDAHAELGHLALGTKRTRERALAHFRVGTAIGDLALGPDFDGVLEWSWVENRPFLRCLHGQALALWALERPDEAAPLLERLLWLNPNDNQGARFDLVDVRAGEPWSPAG